MFTAEEARAIAFDKMSQRDKSELKAAEDSINQAIENGKMSCYCYKWLGVKVISELERLGYKVKNESNQRDGTMFEISW